MKHAVLARDHSLGREYLGRDEVIPIGDDFSWDSSLLDRNLSYGSVGPYPPGRDPSYGSHGALPPHFPPSRGPSYSSGSYGPPVPPPPTPGDYYRSMSQEQRQQSYGSHRYDSWSRIPSGGSVPPPPMPPYYGSSRDPYQSDGYGSVQSVPLSRDHSLSYNPLRNASVSHPVNPTTFDSRSGSGHWPHPNVPPTASHPPSMAPHSFPHHRSGDDNHFLRNPSGSYDSGHTARPAPKVKPGTAHSSNKPYEIDPEIAKSWSTHSEDFDIASSLLTENDVRRSWSGEENRGNERQTSSPGNRVFERDSNSIARPDIVKRMTSNQNEDVETKRDYMGDGRSIKRAALNRDNSMASNRLKEAYAPGALRKPQTLDNDMRSLSISMEQSSLEPKPKPLSHDERMSTLDMSTIEMLSKPKALDGKDRTSTIDELIDLDDDDVLLNPIDVLPKPPTLRISGRLSTAEYYDIVNEPLGDDY